AQRTRAVRDELAMANTEVAALRRNWSRKAAAATDSQEVTELRERLAAVTQRYDSLVAKYRELSEAARYAATARKHLQGIVRQWDAMCVRLYKATGGRPTREADKKVLPTWSRCRELVRKDLTGQWPRWWPSGLSLTVATVHFEPVRPGVHMVVSISKMSIAYYLSTVATGDQPQATTKPLTAYYTETATPPGRWWGQGLTGLSGITNGQE